MPELWGLLALFIVWVIVTVCGHVSWVMTAAVLKALFGNPTAAPLRRCPSCGRQTLANGQCNYCLVVPSITVAQRSREELTATAKHLSRLQKAGHLPYEQAVALLKVIETDLARLGGAVSPEVWRELELRAVGPEVQPSGVVAESRESSVGSGIDSASPNSATRFTKLGSTLR